VDVQAASGHALRADAERIQDFEGAIGFDDQIAQAGIPETIRGARPTHQPLQQLQDSATTTAGSSSANQSSKIGIK
jgi:hypothetical protein